MHNNGVKWWKTPAESPDLNPIENVWAALKSFLRDQVKPTNEATLVQGILGKHEACRMQNVYTSPSKSNAKGCG